MIVNRNGQYLPKTVHDHEIAWRWVAGGGEQLGELGGLGSWGAGGAGRL
jgi:hypothetical protein